MLDNAYSQQNWIDGIDHIPIHTTFWPYWLYVPGAEESVDKMKDAGIEVLTPDSINLAILDSLTKQGREFKLLPGKAQIGDLMVDYINHYTNARYAVWEAEGTSPSVSEAEIKFEDTLMEPIDNFIRLIDTVANNSGIELIKGPYFMQFVYSPEKIYIDKQEFSLTRYRADFHLRLISNSYLPDTLNPNTPICIVQVTQSIIDTPITEGWPFRCTYIVKQDTLRRTDFDLNQFNEFQLSYELDSTECSYYSAADTNNFKGLIKRDYVQYKVIWLGQSNYLLDIDKVVVSDESGRDLKRSDPITFANIRAQDNAVALTQYQNSVTGWNGADEPHTIDQFEPMRIVDSLLDSKSNFKRPVWYPLVGAWDGVWENHENPWGTYHLSIWDELKKRVGAMNVWQDSYFLDTPFMNNLPTNIDPYGCGCDDYRVKNIEIAARNFEQAYNISPNFGASIQCGEIKNWASNQRNISSSELLYEVNLALLYGAKFISLYTYFAHDSITATISRPGKGVGVGGVEHGIVDFTKSGDIYDMIYTPKYYTLRDTISPRLKGLMGKTLKTLTPTAQYLNHTLSSSEGFIQSIMKGGCTVQGIQPSNEAYDLGFFTDDLDRDYFMIISRWYNGGCNPALTINLNPDYYSGYNLKVADLINGQISYTNRFGTISTAPVVGDAGFFGVFPVVKYGGLLAYNDTIKTNTTLSDNMTIDAGKVLQINEGKTYTITDTITFTDTSSFITGYGYVNRTQNGWITTRSWNKSLFKGRSGSHPKLIWSKHPDITSIIEFKIYRNHANGGWQYLTSISNSTFEYVDTTITIIEGMPQANEVSTEYRVTATYRLSKLVIETGPTNTILYHRVEGQGLEKQNTGLTGNDFTYNLDQNYPNPFNPTTTINYSIAEDGIVTLEIMNILGERIKILVNEFKNRGNHNISFNASSLASGVYIYKIQAGDFITSKKMVLLK